MFSFCALKPVLAAAEYGLLLAIGSGIALAALLLDVPYVTL